MHEIGQKLKLLIFFHIFDLSKWGGGRLQPPYPPLAAPLVLVLVLALKGFEVLKNCAILRSKMS